MRRPVSVLLLLGALLTPGHARAAVSVGADQVVVTGDGAGAIVRRDPFGIAFTDGAGKAVLSEAGSTTTPFVVAPVPGPVPLGQDAVRSAALYAPLTFTVGDGTTLQAPATQYAGNTITGVEGGVSYDATKVQSVTADGDLATLVLATDDPTGRTLNLSIAPAADHQIRVSVRPSDPTGISAMGDAFTSPAGEAFRGFGGRRNAIDQRGEDFINWTEQENTGSGEAASGPSDTSTFPDGRTAGYYVQSQFVSSAGYGFLLDRTELSRWRMGSDRPDGWAVQVAAPALDYQVAPGAPPTAIADLTATTGRQRVPPDWALGSLWDREVKYPSDNPTDYLAAVEQDLADFKTYGIHVDGYRIEGWQFLTRDQLRMVIGQLKALGIHPLVYFRAFVGQDKIGTDDPAEYDEALAQGYVATHADGSPYTFLSNFQANAALIDFTNPAAVAWWKGRITEALELGADGFMEDFGEQTMTDMHFHDGSTGLQMHNRYGVLYHQATREALDAWQAAHPDAQTWFFTRTGYSGTPGAAAYENANFAGDGTTDFSRSTGLAAQAPDMLNRAIGGAYGFTTDIGGYFDLGPYPATTKELFNRWAAWAALSPYFRLHGSVLNGLHSPQSYDAETVANYNAFLQLHLAARGLIKSLMAAAVATGIPPTRPLWLADPGDASVATQDEEWELGPDVLVAPVVTQGATGRDVAFPTGCWQSPLTGQQVTGPMTAHVDAGLDALPYFFRCGTAPFVAAASGGASLPSAVTCTSRRHFRIHLRGRGILTARVYVNGKAVRATRHGAVIDLRGLPRGTARVRVVTHTRAGRARVARRSYRTCTARGRVT